MLASPLTRKCVYSYVVYSAPPSLKDRLTEVMAAMRWTKDTELAKAAEVSRSAAAQWLGKGSKDIKSINLAPAMKLQSATGFAALWLSKGEGPKQAGAQPPADEQEKRVYRAAEPVPAYHLAPSAALGKIVAAFIGQDEAVRSAAAELAASAIRRPADAELLGRKLDALAVDVGNSTRKVA